MLQQVGRGRKKESRAREGGEERSRQVREGPAGTEQQLVFVSEREEEAKRRGKVTSTL